MHDELEEPKPEYLDTIDDKIAEEIFIDDDTSMIPQAHNGHHMNLEIKFNII